MSFHVTSICTNHKFGSATRKQVISFLADKASDDGSGIWCSKGTIAQSTELGKSTVKRTITQFVNEGIILETGKRSNNRGYTVEYRINLDRVAQLPGTAFCGLIRLSLKVFCSNRLYAMTRPVPSHQIILSRSARFARNT